MVVTCRRCGGTFSESEINERLQGVCPRCLAAAAMEPVGTETSARPSEEPLPLKLGDRFHEMELVRLIGRGGMGIVYEARQSQLDRVVALKILPRELGQDPGFVERFKREAEAAARLKHPNIVTVHESGVIDGHHFLIEEYVEGQTLEELLRRQVPLRQLATWLADVAMALAHAHERGITHRDIKPSNILVDGDGNPRLVDFGIAKDTWREPRKTLTMTGDILGSPAYMSPEQAAGRSCDVGPASDIYALGVILYEMLVGRPPFDAPDLQKLLRAISEEEPIPPHRIRPGVPADLEAICLQAMEKDRERRYHTAGAFAEDLGHWLREEPVEARKYTPVRRASRWVYRKRRTVAAAVALLAAIACLWTWGWSSRKQANTAVEQNRRVLGEVYQKGEEAVDDFETRLLRYPMPSDLVKSLAEERLGLLNALISNYPDFGPLYSWRGRVYELLGLMEDAEADYDHACASSPDYAVVWYLRGTHRIEEYGHLRGFASLVFAGESCVDVPERPAENAAERRLRETGEQDLNTMDGLRFDPLVGDEDHRIEHALLVAYRGRAEEVSTALTWISDLRGPKASRARGILHLFSKEFGAAERDLSATLEALPRDVDALQSRAFARLAIAPALRAHGDDPRPAIRAALEDLNQGIAIHPWSASLFNTRSLAWFHLGNIEKVRGNNPSAAYVRAAFDAMAALGREPGRRVGYLSLAAAWLRLAEGQVAKGEEGGANYWRSLLACDGAIRCDPDCAIAYETRGVVKMSLADARARIGEVRVELYESAIADLEESVHLGIAIAAPQEALVAAWVRMAECQRLRGQDPQECYRRALAKADLAIQQDPTSAFAFMNRGVALDSHGNSLGPRGGDPGPSYEAALSSLTEALSLDPGYAEAYVNRCYAWVHLAEVQRRHGTDPRPSYRNGVADCTEALARRPGLSEAYVNRALAMIGLADWEAAHKLDGRADFKNAIADCGEALARNPKLGAAYCNRGGAWEGLGEAEAAIGMHPEESYHHAEDDLRAAVALGIHSAHLELAHLYSAMGRLSDAVKECNACVRTCPEMARVAFLESLRLCTILSKERR